MEAGQLETLYGIPRHIQYTVFTLKDTRDTHQRLLVSVLDQHSKNVNVQMRFKKIMHNNLCWFSIVFFL